jgi:hypothetical protein
MLLMMLDDDVDHDNVYDDYEKDTWWERRQQERREQHLKQGPTSGQQHTKWMLGNLDANLSQECTMLFPSPARPQALVSLLSSAAGGQTRS